MNSTLRYYLTTAFLSGFRNLQYPQHLGGGICSVLPPSPLGVPIPNKVLVSYQFPNILSFFHSQFFSCFLLSKSFIYLDFSLSASYVRKFLALSCFCGEESLLIFISFLCNPQQLKNFPFHIQIGLLFIFSSASTSVL